MRGAIQLGYAISDPGAGLGGRCLSIGDAGEGDGAPENQATGGCRVPGKLPMSASGALQPLARTRR